MKKLKVLGSILAVVLIPALAPAASFHPIVGCNAEFGGDKLLTVLYSDGSTQDVNAGQGFSLFGGVAAQGLVDLDPITLDLQATLGVKYATISQASNGSIDYFRFPAELLGFFHWKGLRVGAGPVYHFGNSISGSGVLTGYQHNFDSALGLTIQADYTFGDHWNAGLRYTVISYQESNGGIPSTNANNFGVEFGYFI
jgi:hypothetical protein